MKQITFWTDGGCEGTASKKEPKGTSVGIVGVCGTARREWSLAVGQGTNQTAELHAVREALLRVPDRSKWHVHIVTDSMYVRGVLSGNWRPKLNLLLIHEIHHLMAECGRFTIEWVRGHSETPENCRADELASAVFRPTKKKKRNAITENGQGAAGPAA